MFEAMQPYTIFNVHVVIFAMDYTHAFEMMA